ncbi:MAG: tetratricopeptide repeat protein [Calditrichales bacterium]|nr:MAG: tetratricopeptide repeat protein [Calditrichales bacterium]
MRFQNLFLAAVVFSLAFLMNACRPPELEQTVIDYNAGRFENAYEEALKSTQKYPENEEAWFYLGQIQGRKGLIKEMVTSFDKSLAIKPTFTNEIDLSKRNYYGKYFNDAVAAYNSMIKVEDKTSKEGQEKVALVVDNFTKSLYIKNDYLANRLISVSYQFIEDDENALKYLILASEAAPDTAQAWSDLGYYYQRNKDFAKAAEQFKKGFEVDPTHVESYIRYAESLDLADMKDEAIEAYKMAFDKNPTEKAIPFNLGLLYFKKATAIKDDDDTRNSLIKESIAYFEKAHTLDPEIKEIYDLLGSLLLQVGDFDRAKELLEQGVEIFPDSSSIWQNLSFLYAKTGQKVKAEEAFKRSNQLQSQQ